MTGPPGKQPLAEGGYPVEIKVNNNNNNNNIRNIHGDKLIISNTYLIRHIRKNLKHIFAFLVTSAQTLIAHQWRTRLRVTSLKISML